LNNKFEVTLNPKISPSFGDCNFHS